MSRNSAWGNTSTTGRKYVTLAPDVYIKLMGDTEVELCPVCNQKVDFNDYITSVTTNSNIDSPPGNASFQMVIPDTDRVQFFQDGAFIMVPMMEVEIYAKGYYLVGGVPQYYRIFWGMITQISQSWSNGATRISINCKDILYWWDITYTNLSTALLAQATPGAAPTLLTQNRYAGSNPFTVMLSLAQDAMGTFLIPEASLFSYDAALSGPDRGRFIAVRDQITAYWARRFTRIFNNFYIYGASGQIYSNFSIKEGQTITSIASEILEKEKAYDADPAQPSFLRTRPEDIVAFKYPLASLSLELFNTNQQSKLTIAKHVRDQLGYEFYCDTTGSIVFKPPFYNLPTIVNKPNSWIQDFEIISEDFTIDEAEIVTMVTASGAALSGNINYGISNDFMTNRAAVVDYHLAKRYGMRRQEYNVEWAGDAKALYYHIMDHMDKINARATYGNMSLPMRPELRMGFPVYIPKYDSYYYVSGISHSYSVGSTATTNLTLIAKRSRFVAPTGVGDLTFTDEEEKQIYKASWDSSGTTEQLVKPRRSDGRLKGTEEVVLLYKEPPNFKIFDNSAGCNTEIQNTIARKGGEISGTGIQPQSANDTKTQQLFDGALRNGISERLRNGRTGIHADSAGVYDYAVDLTHSIKDIRLVPGLSYQVSGQSSAAQEFDSLTNQLNTFNERISEKLKEIIKYKDSRDKSLRRNPVNDSAPVNDEWLTAAYEEIALHRKGITYVQDQLFVIKRDNKNNYLIRPVSDEYGFEVIGHYRYGRGVRVESSGYFTIDKDSQNTNKSTIQFSNNVSVTNVQSGSYTEDRDQARLLENLTPTNIDRDVQEELPLNMKAEDFQSYDPIINTSLGPIGSKVSIDVNPTTAAELLVNLGPSIDMSALGTTTTNCNCAVSRASWLKILPSNVLSQISKGGVITNDSFFDKLNEYLVEQFNKRIYGNIQRLEKYSTQTPSAEIRVRINDSAGLNESGAFAASRLEATGTNGGVLVPTASETLNSGNINQ